MQDACTIFPVKLHEFMHASIQPHVAAVPTWYARGTTPSGALQRGTPCKRNRWGIQVTETSILEVQGSARRARSAKWFVVLYCVRCNHTRRLLRRCVVPCRAATMPRCVAMRSVPASLATGSATESCWMCCRAPRTSGWKLVNPNCRPLESKPYLLDPEP
jgi:hypothetical protein